MMKKKTNFCFAMSIRKIERENSIFCLDFSNKKRKNWLIYSVCWAISSTKFCWVRTIGFCARGALLFASFTHASTHLCWYCLHLSIFIWFPLIYRVAIFYFPLLCNIFTHTCIHTHKYISLNRFNQTRKKDEQQQQQQQKFKVIWSYIKRWCILFICTFFTCFNLRRTFFTVFRPNRNSYKHFASNSDRVSCKNQ